MAASVFLDAPFVVNSPHTTVTDEEVRSGLELFLLPIVVTKTLGPMFGQIVSTYTYNTVSVEGTTVTPKAETYTFKTQRRVPKTGMMLVGWGGNNGSTVRCWARNKCLEQNQYLTRCARRGHQCLHGLLGLPCEFDPCVAGHGGRHCEPEEHDLVYQGGREDLKLLWQRDAGFDHPDRNQRGGSGRARSPEKLAAYGEPQRPRHWRLGHLEGLSSSY